MAIERTCERRAAPRRRAEVRALTREVKADEVAKINIHANSVMVINGQLLFSR